MYPTLIIFVVAVILFAFIYYFIESRDSLDAVYQSVMIQTLVGVPENPKRDSTKVMMSLQAIVSYVLTAGIIVFAARRFGHSNVQK